MLIDSVSGGGKTDWSAHGAGMTPGQATGMVAGVMVATPLGWRPVEAIIAGDEVMTFDGGLQRVQAVSRSVLWMKTEQECPQAMWPLQIPKGLLGNRRPLQLLPEETVVMESDAAEEAYGDPFALVPALALEGLPGVERVRPTGVVEVVHLAFEEDQVIFVEGSALIFCPSTVAGEPISLAQLVEAPGAASTYNVLPLEDARLLATCFQMERARLDIGGQSAAIYAA